MSLCTVMYSISDLYRNICFSYIFNNDLMIRDRIFLWVVVSKGFTFTNLHTCPIPMKWSFWIPVVKRHSQCNRRFTHLQIFPYSLRSCLWFPVVDNTFTFTDLHTCPIPMRWSFWIPVVKRAFTLQQKIYTFTNISLFFEVMFLIPCSGQHITFTHLHKCLTPILWFF